MELLHRLVITLLFITCSSAAQADLLEVRFHGYITGSNDEFGNLFGAGAGKDTVVGEEIYGSYWVDLGLAEYFYYDNDFAGDLAYSAPEGSRGFISTEFHIGERAYSMPAVSDYDTDTEQVYMGKGWDFEREEWGFWEIGDQYSKISGDNIDIDYFLEMSFSGVLMDYLGALTLDQEFSWSDSDFADNTTGGGGRFLSESITGIGIALFQLDSLQAIRVPAEVAEPSSLLLLFLGLVPLAARRRKQVAH